MTLRNPLLNRPPNPTAPAERDSTNSSTLGDPSTLSLAATRAVTGTPVWITVAPEPIYGVLHMPPGVERTRVGVLILPTFGWDSDCSYRARRHWATQLAESGVAAARIDLPGTEDSVGSPLAPHRVESWIEATNAAADWLRSVSGCELVVAIGIGLGGVVAYHAAIRGDSIDDLVLWATRATGRAYLRELRAYATVASGEIGDEPDPPRSDGAISIAGHLMSRETVDALTELRIAGVPLPDAPGRRVLLIGRDGHGVDPKLRDHLAGEGVELTLLEADDYHQLVALPELRMVPAKTIDASIDWVLSDRPARGRRLPAADAARTVSAASEIEFDQDGTLIRERICEFQTPSGRLIGIVSEPAVAPSQPASYCLVAINSGELRRTGPNRLLVEVTRRAAAAGVPAARFDLPGLGDSDGDSVRSFHRTFDDDAQTLSAIDEIYDQLERLGVAERFVPVGLCLGAYFSIRAVLENRRSVGAIAINPPAFRWTSVQLNTLRRGLATVAPEVVTPAAPRRELHPALTALTSRASRAVRVIELRARRRLARWDTLWRLARRAGAAETLRTLDRLASRSAPILLLLAEDESVLRLLEQPKPAAKLGSCPNITVVRLPTHDHILRPLASQAAALEHIAAALRHGGWSTTPGPGAAAHPEAETQGALVGPR